MKVAVLSTIVPFYRGGAEILADAVTARIAAHGHDVRQIRIPFAWEPAPRVVESLLAFRLLDLDAYDRVIAFKFPAYCVPHDDKVVWLFHQFRQAYDLWGTPFQGLPSTDEGHAIRRAVIAADQNDLVPAPRLYCNSDVTAARLRRYSGRDAEVLHAPLVDASIFHAGAYGDYIFCPSRICAGKRQHLLVEAMAHVRARVRLVLAGQPETPGDLAELHRRIDALGLHDRVVIDPRFISEQEKADLLASSLAVAYIPYDEDSYGFVTLEAYHARRPVLTSDDAGGVLRLVVHGESGYVATADAVALAEGIDFLAMNRNGLPGMAEAGLARAAELGIGWNHVMERLLS
jgi:glycosyltransferase involved in cell wall biosynthesis